MSYKDFSWKKAKKDFNLTTVEGERFLPETPLVNASPVPPTNVVLGMLIWMIEQV